jgi:hypothetical protein
MHWNCWNGRWRGATTKDRASRDPWRWAEHGLSNVPKHGPSKKELDAMTPWQRMKLTIEAEKKKQGAAPDVPASPSKVKMPRRLLKRFPHVPVATLRRLNAYCGHSYSRVAHYIEEYEGEEKTLAEQFGGKAAGSVADGAS